MATHYQRELAPSQAPRRNNHLQSVDNSEAPTEELFPVAEIHSRLNDDTPTRTLHDDRDRDTSPANHRSRFGRKAAIAIGTVAAAVLVPVALHQSDQEFAAGDAADAGTSLESGNGVAERPVDLTTDTATASEFNEYFTDAERIQWADTQLDAPSTDPEYPNMTVEQAAYQRVKETMMRESGVPLEPLVEPSLSNTPLETSVQALTIEAAAMYEMDLDKAKKILSAVLDPNSDLYASYVEDLERIHQSDPSQQELYSKIIGYSYTPYDPNLPGLVPQATGVSTEAPIASIIPVDGQPTRVVMQTVSQTSAHIPDYEEVQSFVDGRRWVAQDKITPQDAGQWIPPSQLVTLPAK